MEESKPLWNIALAGCGEVAKKMAYFSDEMDKIQKRSDWDKISKKIYKDNKNSIDDLYKHEKESWPYHDFHSSGYDAGLIESYFLSIDPMRLEMAPAQFIAGWYVYLTD